jgi:hypothetical protein
LNRNFRTSSIISLDLSRKPIKFPKKINLSPNSKLERIYFLIDRNESRFECNDPIAQILFVSINSEKLLEFSNYLFLNIVSIFSVDWK